MTAAFSRFAPFIREYIYRERWGAIHGIQEKAAAEIFDRDCHVLIAAGTAGGKTEAAFFPILSILDTIFRGGNKALVLYISPLKALINDQAQRLEHLLMAGRDSDEAHIPVWRWHGDIDSGSKNRFLGNPSGILLITPESLEALLLRKSREISRIFSSLLFAVIDEVHVFMGSDRGSQLICQLARIGDAKEGNFIQIRRIGLSATLGDYDGGKQWLSQGTSLTTELVEEDTINGKKLSLALGYHTLAPGFKKSAAFYQALYDQSRNKRAIIFTNSRQEAEECTASLGALAKKLGEPDIFLLHHGSVSAMLRDEAEGQLKSGEGPQVICATATLELGIDIGSLDRIIQLGPPGSVAAFVQRLGRSGRRDAGGGRAEMYFGISGPAIKGTTGKANTGDLANIPWELLRAIAVIELYLKEKWIEPPEEKPLPLSLLIHQTLAILASLGEHSAESLAKKTLSLPPFKKIPPGDFRALVSWLLDCAFIGNTAEGGLILGLEGERLVNHYSFYPIFPGDDTFRVLSEGREIGTINFIPAPLAALTVGGQRWVVKSIDGPKKEIWVTRTEDEGNERLWRGRGGETHSRIIEKIRQIISENRGAPGAASLRDKYPYLNAMAAECLEKGSSAAAFLGITEYPVLYEEAESSPATVHVFPWTGSAGMRTIAAALGGDTNRKKLGMVSINELEGLYFSITTKLAPDEFYSSLIEVLGKEIPVFRGDNGGQDTLPIQAKGLPFTDKYDYLLPPKLLVKQYAANMLDPGALEKLLFELKKGRKAADNWYIESKDGA